GIVDAVLGGVSASINTALLSAGMENSTAAKVSGGFLSVLKGMSGLARFNSGVGSSTGAPPGFIVDAVVPLFAPQVFDSDVIPSYCGITEPYLQSSRTWMETWATNNPTAYLTDFQNAANV